MLTPLLACATQGLERGPRLQCLAARADGQGRYWVTGLDGHGEVCFDMPLPGRGHGLALAPAHDQAVVVARRPGNFLVVLDLVQGRLQQQLEGRPDRHFYGHAVYSPDGRWLYTPENDYGAGRGVIGVRDVRNGYRWVREIASHGIGPHDLALLSDGRTLVVANGGIRTHPDTGRAKLNLDRMRPSVAYVDLETGDLLERHELAQQWHRNSIRHLALGDADRVCLVMQYQGSRDDRPPLVGMHRRGEALRLCSAPAVVQRRMRNYCGSVVADPSGQFFAVSSPRGNLVTFWAGQDGRLVGHVELTDACGLAAGAMAGEFLLSSGRGLMMRYRLDGDRVQPLSPAALRDARWDNHMLAVPDQLG